MKHTVNILTFEDGREVIVANTEVQTIAVTVNKKEPVSTEEIKVNATEEELTNMLENPDTITFDKTEKTLVRKA